MNSYVLQHGEHHGFKDTEKRERCLFKRGDVVELTDEAAAAFGDKFKSYEVAAAETEGLKAAEKKVAAEVEAKANAKTKQQAKAKEEATTASKVKAAAAAAKASGVAGKAA